MTSKEIIDTIKDNIELDDYGNHIYYTAICDKILLDIKHEKINMLKEFIKWYDEQVATDRSGRPIARVVASLDEWVEWFLEENKNGKNQ